MASKRPFSSINRAVQRLRERKRPPTTRATIGDFFRRVAQRASDAFGSSWAFLTAVAIVIVWAATGPLFGFSDTWQLVINTGTTIVTFLMVFLIQNAQNRDAKALHLKIDELIHSIHGARNKLIDLQNCTDEELSQLQEEFTRLAAQRSSPKKTNGNHPASGQKSTR
jgi:low affinity Fe/Cu permease